MENEERYRRLVGEQLDKSDLGKECSDFIDSKIGRYLMDRAEKDQQAAYQEFKDADITDAKAIQSIQSKVNAPGISFAWLMDAINEGNNAQKIIAEEMADEDEG